MNLLSASLSGAAIAALVAALVVTALYLLKPPPRRLLVPSSLIWDRVLRESLRNSDRLRWWLSLLLAAVIAVSMVVAVTRPQLTGAGEAADRLVLVARQLADARHPNDRRCDPLDPRAGQSARDARTTQRG